MHLNQNTSTIPIGIIRQAGVKLNVLKSVKEHRGVTQLATDILITL